MQQVHSKENCLLYLGEGIVDKVEKYTIYAPGNRCLNCSVKTGKPGVDGYGVIRLPASLTLNENREVVNTAEPLRSGARICLYQCKIPKNVEVKSELDTRSEDHP